MAQLRNKLSALVLWTAFIALYLGGVTMLVIGLILSSRAWWATMHQHASLWAVSGKTAELLVMAVGLLLILIIPVFRRTAVGRTGVWKTGRRAEKDGRVAAKKDRSLVTL